MHIDCFQEFTNLNLRESQEKEQKSFDLKVEGEPSYINEYSKSHRMVVDRPRNQPLGRVLEGDESTNDCPVHAKPFQVRFGHRSIRKCFKSGIAW